MRYGLGMFLVFIGVSVICGGYLWGWLSFLLGILLWVWAVNVKMKTEPYAHLPWARIWILIGGACGSYFEYRDHGPSFVFWSCAAVAILLVSNLVFRSIIRRRLRKRLEFSWINPMRTPCTRGVCYTHPQQNRLTIMHDSKTRWWSINKTTSAFGARCFIFSL